MFVNDVVGIIHYVNNIDSLEFRDYDIFFATASGDISLRFKMS